MKENRDCRSAYPQSVMDGCLLQRIALCIGQLVGENFDQVNDGDNTEATEGQELYDAHAGVAQVETVNA